MPKTSWKINPIALKYCQLLCTPPIVLDIRISNILLLQVDLDKNCLLLLCDAIDKYVCVKVSDEDSVSILSVVHSSRDPSQYFHGLLCENICTG